MVPTQVQERNMIIEMYHSDASIKEYLDYVTDHILVHWYNQDI